LEAKLDAQESEKSKTQRSERNIDRTVKDLQLQIDRKEKSNNQLQEDISRHRDKVEKLLTTIDELQSSESQEKLSARRAERELREEREKALRLERELEGLKARGVGGASGLRNSGSWRPGSSWGGDGAIDIPKRKSSISRQVSMSKGFL
jgi:myosin protein heavy chain